MPREIQVGDILRVIVPLGVEIQVGFTGPVIERRIHSNGELVGYMIMLAQYSTTEPVLMYPEEVELASLSVSDEEKNALESIVKELSNAE
jgi:hypothetical protein